MAERRRGLLVASAVVAIVAAGSAVAYATGRSSGPAYRLATVVSAPVQQTVDETGTVHTVNQANLQFPVSGRVATVAVRVGDPVVAGQSVATLDRTSLDQDLETAQATAAAARQTLAADEAAQSGTSSGSAQGQPTTSGAYAANAVGVRALAPGSPAPTRTSAPTPAATPAATPTRGSGPTPVRSGPAAPRAAGSLSTLAAQQQAVVAAQKQLDTAVAAVDSDVRAAAAACRSTTGEPISVSATADGSGRVAGTVGGSRTATVTLEDLDGSPVTTTSSANPQTGVTGPYTFAGLKADGSFLVSVASDATITSASECVAAVNGTGTDQKQVDRSEADLRTALNRLDTALTKLGAAGSGGSGGSGAAAGTARPSSGGQSGAGRSATAAAGTARSASAGSGSAGGGSGSPSATRPITAEQLAADQKAIDAADAEVTAAQQSLGSATLTTPIAGTVGAVSIVPGQDVSSGSTAAAITVLGRGQHSVTTTIGIADVDEVHQGTTATVDVDGVATPLSGRVTYLGTLNTPGTSGSTTTYPVTVLLGAISQPLFDGAGASVALHVGAVTHALTVPASAVHRFGTVSTVSLYAHGSVTSTSVVVGVQGVDRVQIRSGLRAGQQIVLATITAPVPSSSTSIRSGLRGTGGGLGSGFGASGGVGRRAGN